MQSVSRAYRTALARATVDEIEYIEAATRAGDDVARDRGLKWYLIYFTIFFRK